MSTSPTRYYASRPNSRQNARPTSPRADAAHVRSQAVAKLKRAASLPRTPAGKRPPPLSTRLHQDNTDPLQNSTVTPAYATFAPPVVPPASAPLPLQSVPDEDDGSLPASGPSNPSDLQEVLSGSPVTNGFDHAHLYVPLSASQGMQRSTSAASAASSCHIPSPQHFGPFPSMGTPYFTPSPGQAQDWAAMQLAQSYLPSISPLPMGMLPSPFGSGAAGRNTPSPLPTLGELRTLQRSNSAAARAHAMSKLTGGRDTPSDEDHTLQSKSLQRADSVGVRPSRAPLVHPSISQQPGSQAAPLEAQEPASVTPLRPRLQRSFTVSSSNMGEERRSAVGRRMVARLGERWATRQHEEQEVRRLWEERRAGVLSTLGGTDDDRAVVDDEDDDLGEQQDDVYNDREDTGDDTRQIPQLAQIPTVEKTSPVLDSGAELAPSVDSNGDMLAVPDRPVSRGTMRSDTSAFEYEDHLCRSLSSRTARNATGTVSVSESRPTTSASSVINEHEEFHTGNDYYEADDATAPLELPRPAFATPRRTPHGSTTSDSTIQGSLSPGSSADSRDPLSMIIMGSSAPVPGMAKTDNRNWPCEVGENSGSDWGTPLREIEHVPSVDSPSIRGPQINGTGQQNPRTLVSSDRPSPVRTPSTASTPRSYRESTMSWVEVGGPEDQTVRSDTTYHKKSGSISAKFGRNLRTAMRKRSQSKSSASGSIEGQNASPTGLNISVQNSSRRGSESSLSPSSASAARSGVRGSPSISQTDLVRHRPSNTSLTPSLTESANSMLLQHQLASEPSPVSWLPRAELNDPRIHSSKLSPFPGISKLERKASDAAHPPPPPPSHPQLQHQYSDPAVPSQTRVTSDGSVYSLPLNLPSPSESQRGSFESGGKRGWFAKAFDQVTSPRSSTSASRHNSANDFPSLNLPCKSSDELAVDGDPFAAPPPPPKSANRQRPASPTVSVVPEDIEEGSRITRYTATPRIETATPPIDEEETNEKLPARPKDVLARMDDLLALGPDDPARPDILNDPPRKLVLMGQVLQVVNAHTAKDRFLFLFNDILVITKPLITHGVQATLDMKFFVKSIVFLDKLQISGFDPEPTNEPPKHAVIRQFIHEFGQDAPAACKSLVEKSNSKVDIPALASLLFSTVELDRSRIGILLAGDDRLRKAFIDRFHFTDIPIDHALRMFLLAIRLPQDPLASESLLCGFARGYFEANRDRLSYSRELAEDLVVWIMQLNDTLHDMYGFALPNQAITPGVAIAAFQSKDPHGLVSPNLLAEIYTSVRDAPIIQALCSEDESKLGRPVTFEPSVLPSRLTYNTWSESITIRIPSPDPRFKVGLYGEGLEFDPPLLEFGRSATQSFRVRGQSLSTESILFDRIGENAPLYASLGNARGLTIERAFMRHTFQTAFTLPTGVKRRYCFSVADATSKAKWALLLPRYIAASIQAKAEEDRVARPLGSVRQSAQIVAMQVLRDALIPPDQGPTPPTGRQRQGSVSAVYTLTQGKDEADLGPLVPGRLPAASDHQNGIVELQTGKELVLLCRQNSLLPGVLELLQSGVGLPPQAEAQAPGGVIGAQENGGVAVHTTKPLPPAPSSGMGGVGGGYDYQNRFAMGPEAGLERKASRRAGGRI